MTKRKKLDRFVYLSSFAIFMILYLHSFPRMDYGRDTYMWYFVRLHELVDSFPIYIFFFISGVLFLHTNPEGKEIGYADFVYKKLKRLLLPYITLSVAAYPVKAVMSAYAMRPVGFSVRALIETIIVPSRNTIFFFWFLPTLFLVFLFAPSLRKAVFHPHKNILIPLLTVIMIAFNLFNPLKHVLFFNIGGACKVAVYFWAGCVFYLFKDAFERHYRHWHTLIVAVLFVVGHFCGIGESYVRLPVSILCILLFYDLAVIYEERDLKIFRRVDGYSYQIYLLSWFFQVAVRIVFDQVLKMNFLIVFFLLYLSGLVFPIGVAKIVERYVPRLKSFIGL